MHLSSVETRLNLVLKAIGIIILILLFSTLPAFGAIRSAKARVLSDVEDMITSRRANFQTGDILGTPLVSITVRNGAVDAYLLMNLEIQFGGDWSTESAEVSIVKMIPSNEDFTFTNTDMLSYVSNIRYKDLYISPGLKGKLGIESYTDVANMNSLPEGVYSVTLTATEITLATPSDIESNYAVVKPWITASDPDATVEFKVVTIGSINIIERPTLDKLSLTFQVPEIPIYEDANEVSTSSTKIRILGTGLDYTATKQHGKSATTDPDQLKGYPYDTTDGYVTYDLSSVPFRAGQEYSVIIEYIDWNNASITSRTITLDTFNSASQFKTVIDTTDSYQPMFSWYFAGTDYSSMIKEYRIYLNGSYFGYTTGNEFQSSTRLTPGTTYSWYVMPIYKDGTNFLSPGAIETKTFTTAAHTKLDVVIDEPVNNARLFKGDSYGFSGSATFYDGAAQRSATWRIGLETPNGLTTTYTPTRRYASNSLATTLTVVDTLGLSKTSPTINLTVLDPLVTLSGAATRTVDRGAAVKFQLDTQNTRDIATYEWFVDDASVGTGSDLNHTFETSGDHTVYVSGTSPDDLKGNTKTVQSATITVTSIGTGPTVSISQPSSNVDILQGTKLEIVATIEHQNALKEILWNFTSSGSSESLVTTTDTIEFTPTTAGEYTITVTATDIYGKLARASIRTLVINPIVTITSPMANSVFALTSSITPIISAPNADRTEWYLDNTLMTDSSYALSGLDTAKTHTLFARAYYDVVDTQGRPVASYRDSAPVSFTVKDFTPPQPTITFPSRDMRLKTGETYRLTSTVNSATLISKQWWEVDGVKLSGDTYTPATNLTKKVVTLTRFAENSDGIKGSASVTVQMANPAVYLTKPAATSFLLGSVIPINAATVDSELFWMVDGVEKPDWDKTFAQTGIHKVKAGWRLEAIAGSTGSQKVFTGESEEVSFTVYTDQKPVFLTFSPTTPLIVEAVGKMLPFSITAESGNTLQQTKWRRVDASGSAEIAVGNTLTLALNASDLFTIQAIITDNYGLSSTKEWTVRVIAPAVTINSPVAGTTYALRGVQKPVVTTKDVSSFSYIVDGKTVALDFDWNSLAVGSHTLLVEALYTVTTATGPQKVLSEVVSFNVEDRTPPNFTLQGLSQGDRIIAGLSYGLVVEKLNNPTIEVFKNGTKLPMTAGTTADTFTFTPTANERKITLLVRGKLNNITVEKTIELTVLDPYIAIKLPLAVNGLYPASTPIALQYEGRDLDVVTWYVNGNTTTAQALSFASGSHTLGAIGTANGVRLPDKSYSNHTAAGSGTTSQPITVASKIAITELQSVDALYTGAPLVATVVTTGDENNGLIASLTFKVDGQVYREEKAPVSKTISITGLAAGRHIIGVTVTDVFGTSVSKEKPVTVYRPLAIAITQPIDGTRISPDSNVTVSLATLSGQAQQIVWKIDGNSVANSNFTSGSLGKLTPKKYVISATATDIFGSSSTATINIEVQSDFQLNLLAPASQTEILVNNELTCIVGVDKVVGSSVNLTDAAQYISWYVDGTDTGKKGLTYKFLSNTPKNHTIRAEYSKDRMVRTTAEQTIMVRDIAKPVVIKPLNGSTITYSIGESITLSATGEPGATFSWLLGGQTIALGSQASFSPNGLTGQQQLQLVSRAFGQTRDVLATFTLVLNNPPTLNLTAPSVQFTEEKLAWTASVFDVEDKDDLPRIEYLLDGIALDAQSRILTANDIGLHTLMARVTDKNKVTVTKQVGITVEALKRPIQIQSPRADETYFQAFDLPLIANQAGSGGTPIANGTFNWTVQYLDNPSVPAQTFTGGSVVFKPTYTGAVAITVRLTDGNGKERGSQSTSITVKEVPLNLSIYWPHGSIVNAGQALAPQLLGLPADTSQGTIIWTLNGKTVDNIATLTAPINPGTYELKALYTKTGTGSTGSETNRAEISFTVNGKPTVSILNPVTGTQHLTGSPLVLSAKVTDDQVFDGQITWSKWRSNQLVGTLGEGNPFVLENPAPESFTLRASATDRYGLSATSTTEVRVYTPVSAIAVTINNNLSTYLALEGALPLPVKATYLGGITPQVRWTLRQEALQIQKTGAEASFTAKELASFTKAGANITCIITDIGITDPTRQLVFQQEYPILITGEAFAEIILPAAETRLWVGEPVLLGLALRGFNRPAFALTINGNEAVLKWETLEGTTLYGTTLPSSMLTKEGVYELVVTISDNGISKSVPLTLNLYQPRQGIFVDNAPASFDLQGPTVEVEAVIVGLSGVSGTQWKTDLSSSPVATGLKLDLSKANLVPGDRSITVEALSGSTLLKSHSFLLKVFGPMRMQVTPEDSLLIVQQGAPVTLTATGFDRDGTVLNNNAFTWTSHKDGQLKTTPGAGNTFDFSDNPELSLGEHLITVTATGKDGATLSILRRVEVRGAAESEETGTGTEEPDGLGEEDSTPKDFTPGTGIPQGTRGRNKPVGADGGTVDEELLKAANKLILENAKRVLLGQAAKNTANSNTLDEMQLNLTEMALKVRDFGTAAQAAQVVRVQRQLTTTKRYLDLTIRLTREFSADQSNVELASDFLSAVNDFNRRLVVLQLLYDSLVSSLPAALRAKFGESKSTLLQARDLWVQYTNERLHSALTDHDGSVVKA